jgi:RNA polymerase sigma-70 factor (ECF subfamily)
MQMEDAELLNLFKEPASREKAFTELVKKYQERLYWHIRRLVIVHDDADDVLQNTLLKVWHGLDQFKGQSQLFTWMYRIATNEALSFLEQRKRKSTEALDDSEELSNQVRSSEGFNANQLEWKLQLAIQHLPEKQRVVFNLRYYDEMPYEAMSQLLETSEGALKASYHHAAKKIEDFILNH